MVSKQCCTCTSLLNFSCHLKKIKQNKSSCKVRDQMFSAFHWQPQWPQVGALFCLINETVYVKNFPLTWSVRLMIFQIISFQIGEDSAKCRRCGREMSAYFCAVCKHFMSIIKNPYHCEKCGICR